jgi:hypothetical protein
VSKRFEEIARRKQALIEKARLERIELAVACSRISSPFDLSGVLFRVVRVLRAYPLATAGVSSFVIGSLGKKVARWGRLLFKVRRLILPLWAWWMKRRRR